MLAMASRAALADRVSAVLDDRQSRGRAGRLTVALAGALGVAAIAGVSPLILVAAPQAGPRPSFEVASVKPVDRATMHRDHEGHILDAEQFVDRTDLLTYVTQAYLPGAFCTMKVAMGYDCSLISIAPAVPAWIRTDRWEIQAKLPPHSPVYTQRQMRSGDTPQLNQMLQVLLEDRFHLKVHRQTREIAVYAITVAKNGPKLKPTPAGGDRQKIGDGSIAEFHGLWGMERFASPDGTPRERLTFRASSMQEAADGLGRYFDRPVLDRTGLKGNYDFTLEYEVDPTPAPPPVVDKTSGLGGSFANPWSGLSSGALSNALQDVGLKLESTKAPVEVLVIDHAEKPSAN
jgi:uncharacterized protein (TIGR03435 family)